MGRKGRSSNFINGYRPSQPGSFRARTRIWYLDESILNAAQYW